MSIVIKSGYKRTEAGIIPNDWDTKPLAEIAYVSSGGTPNREKSEYWNGDIPWITTSQIDSNRIIKAEEFITKSGLNNSAARLYKKGTLLMAMYGQGKTRGKIAVLDIDATTNQACAAIEVSESVVAKYVFYNLNSRYVEIRQLSNSGSQENLSGSIIKTIPIPLPPPAEQQAIAEALGAVDALLSAQRELLAKKRALKQATQQALLSGEKRLPGFTGDKANLNYKQTLWGLLPEDWAEMRLGQNLKFQVGFPFASEFFNKKREGIRLIKNRDLKADDDIQYYSGPYHQDYLVDDGDVLIGMDGDFMPCIWNKGTALLNQRVARIRVNEKLSPLFLFYSLVEPLKEIERSTASTTVKHLSHGQVESIVCCLPSSAEQHAIAKILSDMDAEVEGLAAQLQKTQTLKQGMMQNLLTGAIRLVPGVAATYPLPTA